MFLTRAPANWASVIRGSLAALVLCAAMTGEAKARIFIGLGVPLFLPPLFVPPPAYYPPYYGPPMAYAPPGDTFSYTPPSAQPRSLAPPRGYGPGYGPGYAPQRGYAPEGYAPQGGYTPSMGRSSVDTPISEGSCRAGAYVCPLVDDTPPGGACNCPGHNGRRIRGQAD